ncbi:OmpA family protein [Gaoshiqia sediminis]|uniref:OmpA family protein n=1 Tax=Gaoshiqia sediminis TaxID=2986998 RepID=A0AA41Y6U3_9BACT|nr:OmpA family protein [Gaoshiqia sediminis]MCW0481978.1 OmpA family protein [Gaoshiqia sediminis]
MKKAILLFVVLGLLSGLSYAQEAKFNKWSLEGGIGLTKPFENFEQGFRSATPDFLATELGVRYMISEYFGLKLGLGYNQFSEADNSQDFTSDQYRVDLQGVVNLGRLMKFESWTKTFNLLAHGGVGVGKLEYDLNPNAKDKVGILLAGATAQVRLSPRVSLNIDGTAMSNIRQNLSFDGTGPGSEHNLGIVFNGTVGLSISLGKNKSHADWYLRENEAINQIDLKIADLDKRVKDLEDNTASKQDLKKTQDGVDDLSKEVDALKDKLDTPPATYEDFLKKMVNDGYINIYFDFNSAKVNQSSVVSVGFLKTYLQKNAGVQVDVLGYADELGSDGYNQKLSEQRAQAAAKLLAESGIEQSRLNAVGKGEDTSVDKSSAQARQMARRVSFVVK